MGDLPNLSVARKRHRRRPWLALQCVACFRVRVLQNYFTAFQRRPIFHYTVFRCIYYIINIIKFYSSGAVPLMMNDEVSGFVSVSYCEASYCEDSIACGLPLLSCEGWFLLGPSRRSKLAAKLSTNIFITSSLLLEHKKKYLSWCPADSRTLPWRWRCVGFPETTRSEYPALSFHGCSRSRFRGVVADLRRGARSHSVQVRQRLVKIQVILVVTYTNAVSSTLSGLWAVQKKCSAIGAPCGK